MTIDDLIASWLDGLDGDIVLPVEAAKLAMRLRAQHAVELRDWLDANAERFIARDMQLRWHAKRSSDRYHRKARTFGDAAERVDAGEIVSVLDDLRYAVDVGNTWRALGDMTKADCAFVAEDRERRGNANLLEATFMRALAKKLGTRTVREVFTEDQIRRMRGDAAA